MFHRPGDLLRTLTDERWTFPGRSELHALLYRLCVKHAREIDNCMRAPSWQKLGTTIRQQISYSLSHDDGALIRRQLEELAGAEAGRLLTGCSAVLQALDDHHRELRPSLEYQLVELPDHLGGGRTVFLSPPEDPVGQLVPEAKRVKRSRRHLDQDVRAALDLWWHLVVLDQAQQEPRCFELDATVSERLRVGLKRNGDLRVGLAAPFAELDFDLHSDPERYHDKKGTPYRFVGIRAAHLETARQQLDRVLEDCAAERIDVLCFPELTLDNDLLEHFRARLAAGERARQPALVVTGSFHLSGEMCWVNRCHVLDERGRLLFVQDKCADFEIPPEDAHEMMKKRPELCEKLGIDERGGFEGIRKSSEVVIADCALGRLATPICRDFIDRSFRQLFIESRINFLLVPAMTPRMERFRDAAYDLGTFNRATTFVVNSAWLLRQLGSLRDRDLFHGYVPTRGSRSPLPLRVSESLAVFSVRELIEGVDPNTMVH